MSTNEAARIPVTVLTGFLGAGKTTLLNRILTENHGKRIAVIENEFGEIGVDQELVIGADEEIFEMNNGCICCTVRGDLIRILGNLMKRRDRFDHILVETTGLADPGPVAQTFFVDAEMQRNLRLDGIVTVVDAKHVWNHFDSSTEVKEQIAFADVILINKTDLVESEELSRLGSRIRGMNAAARVHHTQRGEVNMDHILGVGGFDLNRALTVDPRFLEPEYPFEWAGTFQLAAGALELLVYAGPDPSMKLVVLPVNGPDPEHRQAVQLDAVLAFSDTPREVCAGDALSIGPILNKLSLPRDARFTLDVKEPGYYAVFTEHLPVEFRTRLLHAGRQIEPVATHLFKPDHQHDDEVSSVGISLPGNLQEKKLNAWLRKLLTEFGTDIFRMKGVLSVEGSDKRFVFQGVHMLFDGRPDRPWGSEPRHNAMVFIGRKLDRNALTEGFRSCLA